MSAQRTQAGPGRPALVMALLACAAIWAQLRLDHARGPDRLAPEVLYLASGEHVRLLFPGLEDLLADVYWLRTVQYYGGKVAFDKAQDKSFELLEPLVQITTTLDPRFELAYRYGAIFLAEPAPNGAGRPEAAVALLVKGIENNPDNWRLRWDLGYFQYLFLGDAPSGVRTLLAASELPGAPEWLRNAAAGIATWRGGERQLARVLWNQIRDEAQAEPIERNAVFHLQYLDALDQLDVLHAAIARFEEQAGRPPHSLGELESAGELPLAPEDPTGRRFDYDAQEGRVRIARDSPLWRLVPAEER